jgi:hypothetical protein
MVGTEETIPMEWLDKGSPAPAPRPEVAEGGDHDVPFEFGVRPSTERPAPFNLHQLARLMVLRSLYEADIVSEEIAPPAQATQRHRGLRPRR